MAVDEHLLGNKLLVERIEVKFQIALEFGILFAHDANVRPELLDAPHDESLRHDVGYGQGIVDSLELRLQGFGLVHIVDNAPRLVSQLHAD